MVHAKIDSLDELSKSVFCNLRNAWTPFRILGRHVDAEDPKETVRDILHLRRRPPSHAAHAHRHASFLETELVGQVPPVNTRHRLQDARQLAFCAHVILILVIELYVLRR